MSDKDQQGKQGGLLPDPIGEDAIVHRQEDGRETPKDPQGSRRRHEEGLEGVEAVDPDKIKHDGP